MCHQSPTTSLFGSVLCVGATTFLLYHCWCYDRWRCFVFTKKDAFRTSIVWFLFLSCLAFMLLNFIQTGVKYTNYWTEVPSVGIIPAPWQIWSIHDQHLWKSSYYLLAVGWVLMMLVHYEEILFWAYLIKTIKTQRTRSWFKSIYFKIWIILSITNAGIAFSAASIDTTNLTQMELNCWFSGGILSALASCLSVYVMLIFPGFIEESRRQGANAEVLGKLTYFKRLNVIRTGLRVYYSVAIIIMTSDGFTSKQVINNSLLAMDFIFCSAIFAVMLATILSLLILLPRDMSDEAGYAKTHQVYVRQSNQYTHRQPYTTQAGPPSYKSPMSADAPWAVLGDRLDLNKLDVQDLAEAGHEEFEMPFAPYRDLEDKATSAKPNQSARALNEFRSPLDINAFDQPVDLRVVMNTTTVVEKDS